jgi:sugar-phosphatase
VTARSLALDCAAILFDLDGVLIDSTACVERHWRRWAARHDRDAEELLRIAHGVRSVDTLRLLLEPADVEREAAQFAADEAADTEGVVPVHGAAALLQSLGGTPWAIVTSCGLELARARIGATRLPAPPVLITGSDVIRGKPDPEPYAVAAARLEVPPEACVVVEDSPAGITAGKDAGMRVIGVAFTYAPVDLRLAGAAQVIGRLTDLTVTKGAAGRLMISLQSLPPA